MKDVVFNVRIYRFLEMLPRFDYQLIKLVALHLFDK